MNKDQDNLGEVPNIKYQQLFDKFNEIENLPIEQWKAQHLLGYFVKKYQEHYHNTYQFKFNTPAPSKCFEIFQIKRLGLLLSSNPIILKEYIDWIFTSRVVLQAKRRLTSISFMTKEEVIQNYKLNVLMKKNSPTIDRSQPLSTIYQDIFQTRGHQITTYGDLAFLRSLMEVPEIAEAFQKIIALGFDMDILNRVK